jgi:uncharacterized protein YbjT (DUF2867 family)
MVRILVTGATGYLGGRLVPLLLDEGHDVRALSRDPSRLPVEWRDRVEAITADAGDADSVAHAAAGCDVAYFLIHSLHREDFEAHDRHLAEAFRQGCQQAGVRRIVYLGGLGSEGDPDLSPHLRSRHEVGRVLADGPVPVTELRAAVVIGSGSASFEMLRSLTEVLPAMVVPRWVHRSRCQPIAAADVLQALVAAANRTTVGHEVLELGGPDVVTYREMMQRYAHIAGLRPRRVLAVPVLSPRLSSRWVTLVTPLPGGLSRELVGSLTNDVVVTRPGADEALGLRPMGLDDAIGQAISLVQDLQVPTRWSTPQAGALAGTPDSHDPSWAGGTVLEDERTVRTRDASPEQVFAVVTGIGGGRGWFWGDWMWRLRGLADQLVGGAGLRRGRRHPDELRVGEALDFWVVELLEPDHLRLRAEMRAPGYAWLEWEVGTVDGVTELRQRARFVPRGVWGRVYWWTLVPFHQILFPRMARAIVERAVTSPPATDAAPTVRTP